MNRCYVISILLLLSLVGCSTVSTSQRVTAEDLQLVGNHAGLIQHYKLELSKKPDSAAVMLNLAQAYYDFGDVESASFYVEQLETQGAKQAGLYFLAGRIAADLEQFEQAILHYKEAQSKGYQGADLFINLGIALTNSGQYKAAKAAFNQARLKGHDDITVKNNLAVLYLAQGQYLQAVTLLTPINEQYPDEKKLAFNLAISLFKVGDYRQAHRLLSDDYSDEQILALFHSLRQSPEGDR